MGNWFTYTVGLKEDTDPDGILDVLDESATDELLVADRFENPNGLLPRKYPEWDVLSKKLGRLSWEQSESLSASIAQWCRSLAGEIEVVYAVNVSDTTDSVTIRVLAPPEGCFEEVERRNGEYWTDRDKCDEDGERFPEYAAVVSPRKDPRLGGVKKHINHVRDLEDEYGARPLIHYGRSKPEFEIAGFEERTVHIDRDATGEDNED
jgi:hypothetical protein